MSHEKANSLESARARLAGTRGREFWRSLEELAGDPSFQEVLEREFPAGASEWGEGLDRRRFLQLAAASLAFAGLSACTRQPLESIVPYVRQPEEIVPGRPRLFATAMTLGGYASGLLVESHEGRPTKIEGNPEHPATQGATDVFAQALILGLYDPDRSQLVLEAGEISTWARFIARMSAALPALQANGGAGIRILTGTVTSPTLGEQIRALRTRFPKMGWVQYEPVSRDGARLGARLAFGVPVETRYDFAKADVVVSLDADFLVEGPASVRYARNFAANRRVRVGHERMIRLYAVESTPTATASLADHRLGVPPSEVPFLVWALAAEIGVTGVELPKALPEERARFIREAAADLQRNSGHGIVIPGDYAPAEVHVLAHAINERLGNVGTTVLRTDPVEVEPVDQVASLSTLVDDMRAGRVDLLAIVGENPVFDAPADLEFKEALLKVPLRLHLALEEDETSQYCHWHLPEAHPLEAWSDARAYDGTVTVMQPLIEPLYGGRSAHEFLSVFLDDPPRRGLEILREHWRLMAGREDFETLWRQSLHDGFVVGSVFGPRKFALRKPAAAEAVSAIRAAARDATAAAATAGGAPTDRFEIVFRPDPTIHDGRFANNGWLQELPKPLSKMTWDNAAYLAPAAARRLGVASGDLVAIEAGGRAIEAPAWILPGHPDGAVTVHFGYGRTACGRVGKGTGFDAYPLRSSAAMWSHPGGTIFKIPGRRDLACTQEHFAMEGRDLVRVGTIARFQKDPEFARKMEEAPGRDLNLYPGFNYEGHAWGVSIDLSVCTGCNACVVACVAENNIPVVGKDQVRRGREMHWLRVDRYYEGDSESPDAHMQPVMCMQCEQAPCEVVCPVGATSHSSEGLNDMVYNRCVGTRYCSNNCPYKVRRFNFLQYSDEKTPVLKLGRNPDVTVRSRGVMEKCTYCVQRINAARIAAEKEDRPIRDGEIKTACQQACPTQAIVFGDINDAQSRVARLKAEPANYGLMEHLNTRPRTTYLAKLRNPNPDLEPEKT
ncbi:MAG TPA: TAT-variant-translocated molybdopterin oxidoreductase [Candidatus Polarisedimenticolia bacterium]|nr:TAT-variant-translocated molybdopterin oxidoreductase [Candidatus Polarisedimenticolia bacterium]